MRQFVCILAVCGMVTLTYAAYPTTGLKLHLDASSLTGYNNGDTVLTWPDLAGWDNNATSAGTPTYVTNGLNGRPVIKIDGTSDRNGSDLPHSFDFYTIPTIYNVKTIAFVFKPTSNTYYSWAPMMAGPSNDDYGWHGDTHWGTAYWDYAYSYNSIQNANLAIDGVGGYNGGYTGVDYDHFRVITLQLASGTQFNLGFLAHTARYNDFNVYGMEIAELLVYDQALSTLELEQLQYELGHKYSLWSVKPLHPTDKATMIPANDDLSWKAYDASWGVDVYLDPNQTNVAMGVASAKVVSNQVISSFEPGKLKYSTTYYWRVDLHDPNLPGSEVLIPGPVWSFTTVPPEPIITVHPISQTVSAGTPVDLSVAGENIEKYQWYLNGVKLQGQTNPSLHIASLGIANEGLYTCVASNTVSLDTSTSNPAIVVSKRLIGWWKLDGNLNDSVAEVIPGAVAHNGNITNPDFVGMGKINGAYEFKQDSRVIRIADSNDFFNFYPQGLTVSAWVNTAQAGWGGIVGKIDLIDTNGFFLTHNGEWLVGGVRSLGDLYYGGSGIYNTWHLLTFTLDAGAISIKLYVDGQLREQSVYTTGTPPISPECLYFGAQSADGTVFPYAGLLDDVKIWSYPLDALAIAHLYTDANPGSEVCLGHSVYDTSGPNGAPDCRVNLYDFAAMASEWLGCNIVPTCVD